MHKQVRLKCFWSHIWFTAQREMFLINCLIQLNRVPNEDRVPLILSVTVQEHTCAFLPHFWDNYPSISSTSLSPNNFKCTLQTDRSLWPLCGESTPKKKKALVRRFITGTSWCFLFLLLLNVIHLYIYVRYCEAKKDVRIERGCVTDTRWIFWNFL